MTVNGEEKEKGGKKRDKREEEVIFEMREVVLSQTLTYSPYIVVFASFESLIIRCLSVIAIYNIALTVTFANLTAKLRFRLYFFFRIFKFSANFQF